ncbi:MAG: 50S ribosomal protein L28 [Candidatus Omnitrophica bacterium]|nr:50S ribosomal protein L28 [Candidatus Omnitrophota bacterium]
MGKECFYCKKKVMVGRSIARRGKPIKQGGIGLKTTGITKRTFEPNLQNVKIVIDGKNKRVTACTKCIKAGKVVKAGKKVAKVTKKA